MRGAETAVIGRGRLSGSDRSLIVRLFAENDPTGCGRCHARRSLRSVATLPRSGQVEMSLLFSVWVTDWGNPGGPNGRCGEEAVIPSGAV